jgi:1,4-alpha-glucan branching enzyme
MKFFSFSKQIILLGLMLASHNLLHAFSVTFRVDMNDVSGFNTPEVNGNFNNWCGNCAPMTDNDGDNVWEKTIDLAGGSYEYKFSYDNWSGGETLLPGSPCTNTTGSFTNRVVQVSGTLTLPVVPAQNQSSFR